jgi:hypothetical protein
MQILNFLLWHENGINFFENCSMSKIDEWMGGSWSDKRQEIRDCKRHTEKAKAKAKANQSIIVQHAGCYVLRADRGPFRGHHRPEIPNMSGTQCAHPHHRMI